ncbi:MAG: hypothetical protein V4726_05225 [Verrucomicrobiota bacterium]
MISHSPSPVKGLLSRLFQGRAARLIAGVLALAFLAPEAQAKKYGSGGGKSYSSGSRSSSSSSKSSSGSTRSGGYSSGRSSYSSGSSGRSATPPASTSRSGYDSSAARAKQQADSQKRYAGSKPPPVSAGSTSTGSAGTDSTYRGGSNPAAVPSGRGYASSGSWGNSYSGSSRPYRRSSYSTGAKAAMIGAAVLAPALLVYASRPPVYYQDPYGSPFWWWLLDQPRDVRASWLHHHQSDVDPNRRAELLRADPELQGQVDALAAKNVPVEPNYAPPGLKTDDMFIDPAAQAEADAEAENQSTSSSGSSALFWITVLGGGAVVAWLLFVKRWQPAAQAA